MLIFDEHEKIISLNSLEMEMPKTYFWALNLDIKDYVLNPLTMLEEITGPALELTFGNNSFYLPTSWNILVVDDETSRLDLVEISELTSAKQTVFVYGNKSAMVQLVQPRITDFSQQQTIIAPGINKTHMLCHPIDTNHWINIAPSDTYNKYFRNAVLGDIV